MDQFEDEFQDDEYGDYYDEEDQSMDSQLLRQQLAQQKQMQAMSQQKAVGGLKQPAYSGPGSQPINANILGGPSGAGMFGANSNLMNFGGAGTGTQFGGTQFGSGSSMMGGGGGYTYGMASAGGNTFSSTPLQQNGLKPQTGNGMPGTLGVGGQKPTPGGFSFGSASQFGGIGSGSSGTMFGQGSAGQFGSGAQLGGGAINDPYANVDLDLSKVKTVTIPQKPFEKKSEEEKQEDKKALGSNKSSLKTTKEDFDKAALSKKEVRFGKSITYQVEGDSEPSILAGDKSTDKKIIGEKDLSDGRDEKEKIKAQIEAEAIKQMEDIRIMNEWKAKQAAQDKLKSTNIPTAKTNTAKIPVPTVDVEESGASSSMSKKEGIADSYTSDDFEDTSMSGSGGQLNQATTASNNNTNKLPTVNNLSNAQKTGPVTKPLKKIEESSDIYEDDDFESLSRSQQQMNQVLPVKKPITLPSQLPKVITPTQMQNLPPQPIVRKENQTTMTDVGKYNYSLDPTSGALTMKEMSLKRQLDDSELVAQEQRISLQKLRDENRELELKLKQKDTEFQGQRRDALNAQETSKRMQEQLKDLQHRCNLYRVETEELIKQIDIADAKTREREDQLTLKEAEFDRKLRAQEERILYRRGKSEEREVLDVKREHSIQLEELQNKFEKVREENDYLNTKVAKLEQVEKTLRLQKDPKDQVKKLEGEIQYLQQQLANFQKQDQSKMKSDSSTTIKKELTVAEQIKIQKELAQSDLIIKGYQEENFKAEAKLKEVNFGSKQKDKEISELKRQLHDMQIKKMLDAEKVFVESKNEEVDLQTANVMGPAGSISQKQLKELQDTIINIRNENDQLKRDWNLKEQQLKVLTQKVRDEKTQVEKQLYQTEFLVQEKNAEIQKLRDDSIRERIHLEEQIKELSEKVAWFRKNQQLLTDQEQQLQCQQREINDLKQQLKRSEDERLKQKDLEKRCKLLEETIKAKNPTAAPQLIQATSNLAQNTTENQNEKQLKYRIQQLEGELDDRDKDFERRIRALRQEQERMRQVYEDRAQNPTEARKVHELEQELQRTKTYYQKRIRELEDKYKFKVNIGNIEDGLSDLINEPVKQKSSTRKDSNGEGQQTNQDLQKKINQMTEDRNMLVKRLESSLNKITELEAQVSQQKIQNSQAQDDSQVQQPTKIQKITAANPKLNPFYVEETPQKQDNRENNFQDILKILQSHHVALQKQQNKQLKISELKTLLKNQVTESKIQSLVDHIRDGRIVMDVEDSVAIDYQGKNFVEVNDLLDLLGSLTPGNASPDQTQQKINSFTQDSELPGRGNASYQDLKREYNRLQREKEDDSDFFNGKIRQLKRQLQQATVEKDEAEEYSRQLESQKSRLEKFLKNGISKGGSAEELVQDVNFVMRRLEMLEQQAEERAQNMIGDQSPLKRKVEILQQQLIEEKLLREKVIQKKNSEVAYFKKELESLLDEIARKSNKAF